VATAIKDLPSEVLEMIANNLDLKDLAPCRLVSKSMSEAANNRFAKVFFSRRFHVASSYSVKALVDITAHPFFGKHVTAVIMDGVRMTKHRSRGGPTLWTDPYDEEEEMKVPAFSTTPLSDQVNAKTSSKRSLRISKDTATASRSVSEIASTTTESEVSDARRFSTAKSCTPTLWQRRWHSLSQQPKQLIVLSTSYMSTSKEKQEKTTARSLFVLRR